MGVDAKVISRVYQRLRTIIFHTAEREGMTNKTPGGPLRLLRTPRRVAYTLPPHEPQRTKPERSCTCPLTEGWQENPDGARKRS
jgi:hypothetical protein